jgi:hypothetical protein
MVGGQQHAFVADVGTNIPSMWHVVVAPGVHAIQPVETGLVEKNGHGRPFDVSGP